MRDSEFSLGILFFVGTRFTLACDNQIESDEPILQRIAEVNNQYLTQFESRKAGHLVNKMAKYNEPKVARAEITESALDSLLRGDARVRGLPKFMLDFLNLRPSQHRETLALKSKLITWSSDGLYVLMPNPNQSNHELLMKDPHQAKYQEGGFGLIAWFIHPAIFAGSKFDDRGNILKDIQARGESLRYGKFENRESLKIH